MDRALSGHFIVKPKTKSLDFGTHKKEYYLTYLSIALLNPTFAYYNIFHVLFTLYAFYELNRVGIKLDELFFVIIISLAVLIFGQAITLSKFEVESVVGLYLTFLLPYFVIKRLGPDFWRYFSNVIYFFAVIAIVFWFLQNLSNSFTFLLESISSFFRLDPKSNESVIIYNLEHSRDADFFGIIKNAGFTAEGGVYSGVLIIGIFFNTLLTKKLFSKKNIVFYFSILTTTSTAGYAALFILLIGFSISLEKRTHYFLIFPALIFLIYTAIFDLPFLFHKVSTYYQSELNLYNSSPTGMRLGRFNSALEELNQIEKYPVFGRGIFKSDRYLSLAEKDFGITGSLMGIVNLLSKFGFPFYIIYMFFLYNAFINYSKSNKYVLMFGITGFLSLIAINIGQVMLISSFVLVIVYSHLLGFSKNSCNFSENNL